MAKQLSKQEFDDGVKDGTIENPVIDSFGDGFGEPYIPDRRAFGDRDGERVWAWVRGPKSQEPVIECDYCHDTGKEEADSMDASQVRSPCSKCGKEPTDGG